MTEAVLQVRSLTKVFGGRSGLWRGQTLLRAVDDVSFDVPKGKVVGLVGESGSGKSTIGRTVIRLQSPTTGEIRFMGQDISHYSTRQMRPLRKHMQIVFQDPYSSLDPRKKVGAIIGEGLDLKGRLPYRQRRDAILALMSQVGLEAMHYDRYPHEFSGGQRQRIGIARALAPEPDFIVADEPVAALDSSIRAQVMDLLLKLQEETRVSMLFISHDLGLVRSIADKVLVMYLGKIVEQGDTEAIYSAPQHAYTQALLAAAPKLDPARRAMRKAQWKVPDSPKAP